MQFLKVKSIPHRKHALLPRPTKYAVLSECRVFLRCYSVWYIYTALLEPTNNCLKTEIHLCNS
jgi:hypothetical protein